MSDSGNNLGDCRHGGLKRTCRQCKALAMARDLTELLDSILTWDTLTEDERQQATDAANCAEKATVALQGQMALWQR